jgi:transposase
MDIDLLTEHLWETLQPLLPPQPPRPKGGRPRVDDRTVLDGIVYVLRTGIPWRLLPTGVGCSGITCWRRLRAWQTTGVWQRLHHELLSQLGEADLLDWSRASVDSVSVRAKQGGTWSARIQSIAAREAPSTT